MTQEKIVLTEGNGFHKPTAVIAGSGLAGLACARRLVDQGFQVVMVEAEGQVGGRTADWTDQEGYEIESGVHTFFGVYSRLMNLLQSVGIDVDSIVSWDDKVGFLQPGARLNVFAIDPLRDLGGVVAGLLGNNRLVGPLNKVELGLTLAEGLLNRKQYEHLTVAELAASNNLSTQTFENILRPLCRGLAFSEPEELSSYVLLTLVNHMLARPWKLQAGTFKGGMTSLMTGKIARWLEQKGAIIRTSAPLKAIHLENGAAGKVSAFELENGERLTGDVYVSALPLEVFKELIPQELRTLTYFSNILKLETVPAIAVQLWFDRSFVSRSEFIFQVRSPLVVFQDEAHITFPYSGSRISLQITDRKTDSFSDQQYIDLALQELHRYVPYSVNAKLQKAVVVRHQAISMKPGAEALRPVQASPLPNFFLAGDYTLQDWFTTMEGATRSGEKAAEAVIRRYGVQLLDENVLLDRATATGTAGLQSNLVNLVRSFWV